MKRVGQLLLLILFCFCGIVHAQSRIEGKISDVKDQLKLHNATIMLLTAKDSILTDFTRSDENGKFSLEQPATGEYFIIVTYPKYGEYYAEILPGQHYNNLSIGMTSSATLLEEVIVMGRVPISIKGDTTEYDAGSFKVEKNAKVEDLLKVLPGITVDAFGKITAQGKTVKKMLVDGEEFFGDDPILVSRNIRSDMVDKIQVYEKKSDKAEKTGIDDGERTQTINVKLKEEARRGIFGKVDVGGGSNKFYAGQGFLNYFNQSFKASAYLIASNTGKSGLSYEEVNSMGGDYDGGDNFNGEGVPKSLNTGFLYSDKTANKKHAWRIDYKHIRSDVDLDRSVFTRNAARDTILTSNSSTLASNQNRKHNIGLKYEFKVDSMSDLTVWAGANKRHDNSSSETQSTTVNQFDQKVNDNQRNFKNDSRSEQYNASALYVRRFKKKGRSLSFNYYTSGNKQDGEQDLFSKLTFYKEGNADRDSMLNQKKFVKNNSFSTGGEFAYSEPISKKIILSFEYALNFNRNNNAVQSFDKNQNTGSFDRLDSLYSNDFLYKTTKNTYNLAINYKPLEKLVVNVSNKFENSDLSQLNRMENSKLSRSFFVYNPVVDVNYEIQKNKSISLKYQGTNGLPSLNQIQPLRSNLDPLNEYLGNENLKPSYTNNLNLSFRTYSILEDKFIGIFLSASRTNNALVQNTTIDSLGKTTFVWGNLNHKSNNQISISPMYYGKLSKRFQLRHGGGPSVSFSNNYNYVNTVLANAKVQRYGLNYSLQRSTTKGLDFGIELSPGYLIQDNSIGAMEDSKGFTFSSEGNLKYFLPAKFIVRADFSYSYQAPTAVYSKKFERFVLSPALSKKFRKDEKLELTFMVNDLLKQNVGFDRSQNGTLLTERRYNTISRYYMVKLTWEINKMLVKSK
ncbi:outer membrane beta-barrel protein [Sphingobacterium sp.]|uniref:outer membrane beta-barrel protein n=1 Tax=Sphingobacterium sp. TaxID=341027 RepID=UPI002FDCD2C5